MLENKKKQNRTAERRDQTKLSLASSNSCPQTRNKKHLTMRFMHHGSQQPPERTCHNQDGPHLQSDNYMSENCWVGHNVRSMWKWKPHSPLPQLDNTSNTAITATLCSILYKPTFFPFWSKVLIFSPACQIPYPKLFTWANDLGQSGPGTVNSTEALWKQDWASDLRQWAPWEQGWASDLGCNRPEMARNTGTS